MQKLSRLVYLFHDFNLIVLRIHDENQNPKIMNCRDPIFETLDFG